MRVSFVDLKLQYESIKSEVDEAIHDVIKDSAFIGGKYVKSFEENFAKYCGANFCVTVGNGTDALFIALKVLGIGTGDEVITVANSFIATSEAISMTGARVVFVDCEESYYNIDVAKIEEAISPKTKAIVPVHLYGQPAQMDEIISVARKHNLFVVEDAAQAHGAQYKRRPVGTIGDCGCFSFYPGKNLGAYGDGGAIITNNGELARKARMFANHGRIDKYDHEFEGVNSRLDGLQAAILDVKLKHLDEWNKRRGVIAAMYNKGLEGVVSTPSAMPECRHVFHLYVITVKEREHMRTLLEESGVSTGIHYPIPLPMLKAYRFLKHTESEFPVAVSFSNQILSLPIHGSMPDEQVSYVIDRVIDSVERS
jgi:dTDP-4-amino-4,6-dideoxygalactose transaminase